MKSSFFKRGTTAILFMSIIISTCVEVHAVENSYNYLSDGFKVIDEPLLTDEEMAMFNAEYQTKEEALEEQTTMEEVSIVTPRAALPSIPSNAIAVSGSTPYFTGSYTLTAGSAGYIKLTATQNYNVSVFTAGSTDTYIEVYSNVACTNLVVSNDDGGHGTNALTYFYITSGSTYYIKIRGYNNLTSGNYTFVLHRGRPTSRSEKGDLFSIYNSSTYQTYNNCYTYALGYYVNPKTGYKFRANGQNPGEMAGNAITMSDLSSASVAKNKIETAMTRDFNYFGGDWKEITATAQPRAGYYKVALVLAPNTDYHWYRQLPNGQWGHKPGSTAAKNTDNSNKIIYQPDNADRDGRPTAPNYTSFLGWYEIKVPASVSPRVDFFDLTDEINYPVKQDLTMNDIMELSTGTSYDEAMKVLGEAHDYIGSGMVGSVYKLVDGTEVVVYYANDNIDQIRTINEDGSYETIIE